MQVIVAKYQLLLAVQCQIEEFCQSSLGCATQSREHAVPDPSQRTNHQSHFIYIDQKQALIHDFVMFPTVTCSPGRKQYIWDCRENPQIPLQSEPLCQFHLNQTSITKIRVVIFECHTVPDHPLHHEWQWLAAISPDQPSAPHNKYPLLYDTLQTIIQQSTPEGFCSISGWNSNTVSWC